MSSIATRLATGMRIAVIFLSLAICVAISSLVAVVTLQWGRAFIVWQLLWWLLVSVALGIMTFYFARLVMPAVEDEYVSALGFVGGLIAFLAGLGASIAIIVTGHVSSAPILLYWPLPVGACLFAVGVLANPEKDQIYAARDRRLAREIEIWDKQEKTRDEQLRRWRDATIPRKVEFEDQFLEALYSATAGNTRPVSLGAVWSHLSVAAGRSWAAAGQVKDRAEPPPGDGKRSRAVSRRGSWTDKFCPEMIADTLRVWRERECIDIKSNSYLIDDEFERYVNANNWDEMRLSLTAFGRDLRRRAKKHNVPINEEFDNLQEPSKRDTYGTVGVVVQPGGSASVIINATYQVWQNLPNQDTQLLAIELARLRAELEARATDAKPNYATEAVHTAQLAAEEGDGPTALSHLASVGKWVLRVATEIGTNVAAAAIKAAMGV